MMKKNAVALVLVLAALVLPAAAAPTIQMLKDSSPAYSIKILEDGFAGYAKGTVLSSFCMEYREYFTPGQSYYAVLNEHNNEDGSVDSFAVKGGQDWQNGIYSQGPKHTATSDQLDTRTAYLFTMFTQKDIRFTNQQMLQDAIHYIEAETTSRNDYVTLAEQAVAQGGEWDGMGIGNVRVLNLWEKFDGRNYCGASQDQLIMINPVPAPGAIVLGSIGMMVVGYLRRRHTL